MSGSCSGLKKKIAMRYYFVCIRICMSVSVILVDSRNTNSSWRIIRYSLEILLSLQKRYIPELGAGLFNKFLELSIWSSGWLLRTVLTLRAIFESSKVTLIFVSGDEESCFLSSREKMALFLVESWTWWLTEKIIIMHYIVQGFKTKSPTSPDHTMAKMTPI